MESRTRLIADFFVNYIGEDLGLASETYAYLVGWVAECIGKELNKYKLKKL